MPKVIENLRENLLLEARRQIKSEGYEKTTIRSIAAACGVGIGTVYNYFPSKDMLIATFMAEDWHLCLEKMRSDINGSDDNRAALECVYNTISGFIRDNKRLFSDKDVAVIFATAYSSYHKMLRNQIADCISRLCVNGFAAEFIAEALIIWTVAGKSFDEIFQQLKI